MSVTTGAAKQRSYTGDYMQQGKAGEQIILDFLRQQPLVLGVEDVSSIQPLQTADADFLIQYHTGKLEFAEAKSDAHLGKSGNVLFEYARINHTAHPDHAVQLGWSARTLATLLFIYAPHSHSIYKCNTWRFREAMQRYTGDAREQTRRDWVNTDAGKSTENILIPWSYCKSIFTIYEVPK